MMRWKNVLDRTHDLFGQEGAPLSAIPDEEVIGLFRDAFFAIRRAHIAAYVRGVVEGHALSQREIGKILGYASGGSISAAMAGKIAEDRFALLRATIARQLPQPPRWPCTSEFATLALMRTMSQLAERLHESKQAITPEEFEVLRRLLRKDWLLAVAEEASHVVTAALAAVLDEVHLLCGTNRIKTPSEVEAALQRWGPLYLHCKRAIPGLCGQGEKP